MRTSHPPGGCSRQLGLWQANRQRHFASWGSLDCGHGDLANFILVYCGYIILFTIRVSIARSRLRLRGLSRKFVNNAIDMSWSTIQRTRSSSRSGKNWSTKSTTSNEAKSTPTNRRRVSSNRWEPSSSRASYRLLSEGTFQAL